MTSATPAALEVNSFTLDELLAKTGPGCSILLKRSPDDTDYIFHERLTAEGRGEALIAETPLGDRTDYEVTEIPSATPKFSPRMNLPQPCQQ